MIEHHQGPLDFFLAIRKLLKPWGHFFTVKPNVWHYVGMISNWTGNLGLADGILRLLKGPGLFAEIHHAARYGVNFGRCLS